MIEQISLFAEETAKKYKSMVHLHNDDYSLQVDENDILIREADRVFTKEELLELCREAEHSKKGKFGYNVYFREEKVLKSIYVRFVNEKPKRHETVFDHIRLYFNKY